MIAKYLNFRQVHSQNNNNQTLSFPLSSKWEIQLSRRAGMKFEMKLQITAPDGER